MLEKTRKLGDQKDTCGVVTRNERAENWRKKK